MTISRTVFVFWILFFAFEQTKNAYGSDNTLFNNFEKYMSRSPKIANFKLDQAIRNYQDSPQIVTKLMLLKIEAAYVNHNIDGLEDALIQLNVAHLEPEDKKVWYLGKLRLYLAKQQKIQVLHMLNVELSSLKLGNGIVDRQIKAEIALSKALYKPKFNSRITSATQAK